MDVEQHPLLKLEPDKQQQLVDLVQEGDVDAVADATGMSRRSVILAAAALGVGTIGGGVTARELIQEAQAAASTTDGDGNVGTPQNPVDVFADGISSNSVNTEQLGNNGSTVTLTDRLNSITPSSISTVLGLGESIRLISGQNQTIADDNKVVLRGDAEFGNATRFIIKNNDDNTAAVISSAGASVSFDESSVGWTTTDSDGDNCVFVDSNGDLVLKNRTGDSKTYRIGGIST
jgi:hypothetical protein